MSVLIRKTGFELPLNRYQVGSWVICAFNLLMSAVIFMPTLPYASQVKSNQIAYGILFYVSQVLVIVFGFIATYIDPCDLLYKSQKSSKKASFDCEIGQSICTICNSIIGNLSKHCSICNKCVEQFDHHCKWLNNCIGVLNYKYFITLLWSLQINILVHIIFAIVLFAEFQNNFNGYSERVENPKVYIAFTVLTFVESIGVLVANTYLIGFHSFIKCKGLSTFDFILMRKEKEAEKMKNQVLKKKNTENDNKCPDIITETPNRS